MRGMTLVGKRQDPNYQQVSGYVPKPLALKFKSTCVALEIDISEALEQMIQEWLDKQSTSRGK